MLVRVNAPMFGARKLFFIRGLFLSSFTFKVKHVFLFLLSFENVIKLITIFALWK